MENNKRVIEELVGEDYLKKNYWISGLLIVALLTIVGCGGLLGEKAIPLTELTLGNFGSKLTIKVPFAFTRDTLDLPVDSRSFIAKHEFYSGNNKAIGISITNALYKNPTDSPDWKPSLEGAADGSVMNVSNSTGVRNFTSGMESLTVSGIPARIATMQYTNSNDAKVEHKAFVLMDNNIIWAVSIIYKQEDESSRNLAKQIIQSMAITK